MQHLTEILSDADVKTVIDFRLR